MIRAAILYALALVSAPTLVAAAEPLTVPQRHTVSETLDKLVASRQALAGMVSECNGGIISVLSCSPPPVGGAGVPRCGSGRDPCDLVTALHSTDAAIDSLRKSLKQ